jgi:hypothetical protein
MSTSSDESGIGRCDILSSGGSAIFSSLIAALLGGAKPARAQTISGNVPEVDRATVRVVTDNYHFALSPSGKIGDVEVGRFVFLPLALISLVEFWGGVVYARSCPMLENRRIVPGPPPAYSLAVAQARPRVV